MFEKFRCTKCYKISAMVGIFYILSVIVFFIHAKYFTYHLSALLDLVLMILLGLILSVVFIISTGVAVYQAKKSKEHTAKPVLLYDISYIVSLIIFVFILCLCSFIYITEIRTTPLAKANRYFPNVINKIDKDMNALNMIKDNTCGDSQEKFAKCLAEQMKDVEVVNGNTIITKKWIYTISIKSDVCEPGKNIDDCTITVKKKNSDRESKYLKIYFWTKSRYSNSRFYVRVTWKIITEP